MAQPEKPCRIAFLGSGKVGKTCLIRNLLRLPNNTKYHPTIEDIFYRDIEKVDDRIQFKVEILDTSGSFNFAGMLTLCIAKSTAFVLVFSADDLFSIDQVKQLFSRIREERDDFDMIPLCLVCNKIDLVFDNEATNLRQQIRALQTELDVSESQIILTSSKTNENVNEIFVSLWQQNLEKQVFRLPKPKAVSNWSILLKRRISAIESVKSSNNANISTNLRHPPVVRTNSVLVPGPMGGQIGKETKLTKSSSKSIFKRSSTSESRDWKEGDTLKLDCNVS